MSTLSFEHETKDLYQLGTEEPASRILDVEFDVSWRGGDFECKVEAIWCCDSKKFIGDAPYKLTERDMKAIRDRMYIVAGDNYGDLSEERRNAVKDYFHPIFSDD